MLFILQWLCRRAHGSTAFSDNWHAFKWPHVCVFWIGIFLETSQFCLFCDYPGIYHAANIYTWNVCVIFVDADIRKSNLIRNGYPTTPCILNRSCIERREVATRKGEEGGRL